VILRLPPHDFWRVTPRQYQLLLERHRERERHREWLVGLVLSTIANWSIAAPKEALRPEDFPLMLLKETGRRKPPARVRMTAKRRQQVADSFRAGFARLIERQKKG